jgi:hypothetical protein
VGITIGSAESAANAAPDNDAMETESAVTTAFGLKRFIDLSWLNEVFSAAVSFRTLCTLLSLFVFYG